MTHNVGLKSVAIPQGGYDFLAIVERILPMVGSLSHFD